MDKDQINQNMLQLKMEYARVQGDIEKLESTGQSIKKLEERLLEIENELNLYYSKFTSTKVTASN